MSSLLEQASSFHRTGNIKEAEIIYKKIINESPNSFEANHALGAINLQLKNYKESISWTKKAININSKHHAPYNNLGASYLALKEFYNAISAFSEAIKIKPDYAQAYNSLGITYRRLEQYDNAIINYNKAIELKPDYAEVYNSLGIVLIEKKEFKLSEVNFNKAIKLKPDYAEAYSNFGFLYLKLNKYNQAIDYCKKAIRLNPHYLEAYMNLGAIYLNLKKFDEALINYNQAIKLKPDHADAYSDISIVYKVLKKYETSIEYLNKAIKLKPDHALAYNNLGNLYLEQKKFEESLNYFNEAIKIKPDYADAYFNRSILYAGTKKQPLAIQDIYKTLKLEPENTSKLAYLLGWKNEICEWNDLKPIISTLTKKIIKENSKEYPSHPLLNHIDSLDIFKQLLDFDSNKQRSSKLIQKSKNKKINIGYFSGDFKLHPVGLIVSKFFSLHNKNEFEIIGFSSNTEHNPDDKITKEILNSFDKFYDISEKSDEEVISDLKNISLDIVIDLSGFTKDNRTSLFRKKIAPIQINFLGYPGTIGKFNDYIIADKYVIPEKSKKFYFEKIFYMPNFFLPNNNKESPPDDTLSKKSLNIPENSFVFSCFNNRTKINPFIFNCWMRILKKVNNSIILFVEFDSYAKENLKKEALQRNINPDRLVFSPLIDFDKRLLRYKFCDLFLDTFPYTAHSTASECLWSGTPLLTLVGESFQSRVSFSLLKNLEMDELITYSIEEYEKKAVDIGSNKLLLEQIKNKLIQSVKKTSIFNMTNYVKNLEKGYLEIFNRKKEGRDPDDIYIN